MGAFLNEEAAIGRGYDWDEPSKAHICDLGYIALNQLQNAKLLSSTTPVNELKDMNFQFAFVNSANLDNDPELEWLGVLEPEAPWLVIFDDMNGVWDIQFLDDLFSPVIALEFEQQDITKDGQLETLLTLISEPLYGEPYQTVLLIEYSDDKKFELIASNSDFEELPDLSTIDATFFNLNQTEPEQQPQLDWKRLDGFDIEETLPDSFFNKITVYVEKLTDNVLTQTDPNITSKISDLLNYLPSDDPDAQPYREHLTYLLGYHYELNGDEDTAVPIYLDLIQQNPNSPWSWLAWARLEPVPDP